MSKTYEFECPKHGHLRIEVEKPPLKFNYKGYCPLCLETIRKPVGVKDKQKWQPNYVSKGVNA